MNCKFTLLRYVPDIVKGEFMNLGVALLDESGGFLEARMAGEEEMRRLRWLHPAADLDLIRELESGFAGQMPWESLDKLRQEFSTSLTISEPKICITENWREEIASLFGRYVAAPPRAGREADNPRVQLRQRLAQRFRMEGLLERLKPAPAAPFTVPGDPFKIDYAYVPASNGMQKYIHAVTLDRATHQAKVLAFTFEHIRRKRAHDQMTAVYDGPASAAGPIQELLESSEIRLRPYAEMDSLIREIRRDLALA